MGILHYLQQNTGKLGKIVARVQAHRILDILKKCPCLILVLLCTCFEISTKMAASCKAPIQHDNFHKPPDDNCSHSRDCPEWLCPQAAYRRLKMKVMKKCQRTWPHTRSRADWGKTRETHVPCHVFIHSTHQFYSFPVLVERWAQIWRRSGVLKVEYWTLTSHGAMAWKGRNMNIRGLGLVVESEVEASPRLIFNRVFYSLCVRTCRFTSKF
jgi:hypothetical protein